MRRGARIGVDVGRARIGVSRSDPDGMLAVPVETVPRSSTGDADVSRVAAIAQEFAAIEIVVGHPLALSGRQTASTDDAVSFARRLAAAGHSVRLVDERLSTVSAQHALRATGKSARAQRPIVDQAAAVIILQHALDAERASGRPPGREPAIDESEEPA